MLDTNTFEWNMRCILRWRSSSLSHSCARTRVRVPDDNKTWSHASDTDKFRLFCHFLSHRTLYVLETNSISENVHILAAVHWHIIHRKNGLPGTVYAIFTKKTVAHTLQVHDKFLQPGAQAHLFYQSFTSFERKYSFKMERRLTTATKKHSHRTGLGGPGF